MRPFAHLKYLTIYIDPLQLLKNTAVNKEYDTNTYLTVNFT